MKMKIALASGLAVLTGGCMTTDATTRGEHPGAHADVVNARGQQVAIAEIGQQDGALYVAIDVSGMAPGRYAVHVHTVGRCDGPTYESAGGHWNPAGRQHGFHTDAGPHMGDLPNIAVNAGGRGLVAFQIQDAWLTGGANPLLDADGASVVIHAREDDFQTDPSGNSGDRIACGVLRRSG